MTDACVLCGRKPATGFAKIGDFRYCHGDGEPDPTCYMRAQRQGNSTFWVHEFFVDRMDKDAE